MALGCPHDSFPDSITLISMEFKLWEYLRLSIKSIILQLSDTTQLSQCRSFGSCCRHWVNDMVPSAFSVWLRCIDCKSFKIHAERWLTRKFLVQICTVPVGRVGKGLELVVDCSPLPFPRLIEELTCHFLICHPVYQEHGVFDEYHVNNYNLEVSAKNGGFVQSSSFRLSTGKTWKTSSHGHPIHGTIEATDLHDLTGMAQHHTLFGWHLANPLHASGQVREGRKMEKVIYGKGAKA